MFRPLIFAFLLVPLWSDGQVLLPEMINGTNRFHMGIQTEYSNAMRFGILRMEGYSSVEVVAKNETQTFTERYFFNESGFLDSVVSRSVLQDTIFSKTICKYVHGIDNKDTVAITNKYTTSFPDYKRLDTLYLTLTESTGHPLERELRVCGKNHFFKFRKDSLTGETVRYSGSEIRAADILSYRDSLYADGLFRQFVTTRSRRLTFVYDSDTTLLRWESRSYPQSGYIPGHTEYFYRDQWWKSKVLGVHYPGGAPPHFRDPGKTNFHRNERKLLQKFQQTEYPDGEISGMWIIRKNRKGYVRKVIYKRIVDGRFDRHVWHRFRYKKSEG